jgi:succinoglycan biosynthesis protein ExoM
MPDFALPVLASELPHEELIQAVSISSAPHVSVCICTYQRLSLLRRLLDALRNQDTQGAFTYSVVVVDNDKLRSAEGVVSGFADASGIAIKYCVEPRQNIALARNMAIETVQGDYVAFIDDDEFPTNRWLLTLFEARERFGVDGALGPVKPHFDSAPPRWVVEGRFYDRPSYPTGYVIDGSKGRTGNVLLKKQIFEALDPPFRPEFLTGEDQDFFRRMIEKGHTFIWCHEAVAYEVVPPVRWSRGFMLRRALLRGATSLRHPSCGAVDIAKSMVAVPVYAALLPVSLILGQGRFMLCLVKMFDHLGKLLALVGCHPIKEAYVTE